MKTSSIFQAPLFRRFHGRNPPKFHEQLKRQLTFNVKQKMIIFFCATSQDVFFSHATETKSTERQ